MRGLTIRQREVLDYIIDYFDEHDRSPQGSDIMAKFGWKSPAAITKTLDALETKRYIKRERRKQRNITVLRRE